MIDRKSTRLNSSHTVIYTLSLHDALPISGHGASMASMERLPQFVRESIQVVPARALVPALPDDRSEEHTSELQSHRDLHSFPTRRSSDLRTRSVDGVNGTTASICSRIDPGSPRSSSRASSAG